MSRQDRVAEALKQEVSNIVHHEIKDPRLGFVTITRVEITADLRDAKIFYSVLGKEEDHQKTKAALDSALGFIRRLIAQRIQLRFTPEIMFREDRSSEYSMRIQQILDEINPAVAVKDEKAKMKKKKIKEPNGSKKSRRSRKKK